MPYRRLPNTDQARLRSLKSALTAAETIDPMSLRFSQKLALEVKSFTPIFEQSVNQYADCRSLQSSLGKQVVELGKTARLYLSHFIQVFNMCIARGEIKPEARELLGLEINNSTLPDMSTDSQLISWGKKIVDGEEARMAQGGGNRIYNPSVAVVKVKLSMFQESFDKHRDMLQTIRKHQTKLDELRTKADALILSVWNEVEDSLAPVDTDEKRSICSEYGICYFYRPQERHKEMLVGSYLG